MPKASPSNYSYENYNRASPDTSWTQQRDGVASEVVTSHSYVSTAASKWPTSQTRNTANSHSSDADTTSAAEYSTSSSSRSHETAAAMPSQFNIRPETTNNTARQSGMSPYYSPQNQQQQQQQQTYNQTQQGNPNQHQGWYERGFAGVGSFGNASSTRSSENTGYMNVASNNDAANDPYVYQTRQIGISSHGYGTSQNDIAADLYDLLRNGEH